MIYLEVAVIDDDVHSVGADSESAELVEVISQTERDFFSGSL